MKLLSLLAFVLSAPALSQAQTMSGDAPSSPPTFRAGTELVALTVTVLDQSKQHLAGLAASDFVVLEDGVEQPLTYFGASATPLDLFILVDSSASMGDKMPVVRKAVRELMRGLRPEDRAAVIEFRETVKYRQPMTTDRAAIDEAIDTLSPRGGTAMYNALYVALSEVAPSGTLRRRALVVLSDGDDTASLLSHEDVLEKARRSGVGIYTVALRSTTPPARRVGAQSPLDTQRGEYALRMLARETGGTSFFLTGVGELEGVYRLIAEELRRQYVLGYMPRNAAHDGTWRSVIVRLPTHPRARLRARTGYYAGAHQSAALIDLPIRPR